MDFCVALKRRSMGYEPLEIRKIRSGIFSSTWFPLANDAEKKGAKKTGNFFFLSLRLNVSLAHTLLICTKTAEAKELA